MEDRRTRFGLILTLVTCLVLFAVPWSGAQTPTEDDLLLKEQVALESDASLSGRARRVIFRARSNQDKGDYAKAAEVISNWLDDHPDRDHHLLFFTRALSYENLENYDLALKDLESAVNIEPRFARGWLKRGEVAYQLEYFSVAGDAFSTAYELTPSAPVELLFYAGVTRLLGGDSIKARSDLERLLQLEENDASMEWYQAYLATVQDAGPSAQTGRLVDQLLLDFEDSGPAWQLAAQDALGREEYEQAAVYLSISDFLEPLSYAELIQLGDIYGVIKVPLKAARYFEQAIALDGRATEAGDFERLASAYLAAHKQTEARQAIARGLAVKETFQLWSLLGDLDYMDKDYAEALVDFEKCQALTEDFGRGWLMMGYCALEMGDKEQALHYLAKAEDYPNQASSAGTLIRRLKNN